MESRAVHFSETVRVLAAAAAAAGCTVPAFVTPPHSSGADRVLRRLPRGEFSVAVRTGGRPFAAVQADLIEGVVIVNGLDQQPAGELRRRLWNALDAAGRVESDGVVVPLDPARRRRVEGVSPGRRSA